jgi:hypothetical protein
MLLATAVGQARAIGPMVWMFCSARSFFPP